MANISSAALMPRGDGDWIASVGRQGLTLEYVSPEGTSGESELVDFRSDQWALAVITYRMLSGHLPFEGKNIPVLLTAIRQEQPFPLQQPHNYTQLAGVFDITPVQKLVRDSMVGVLQRIGHRGRSALRHRDL